MSEGDPRAHCTQGRESHKICLETRPLPQTKTKEWQRQPDRPAREEGLREDKAGKVPCSEGPEDQGSHLAQWLMYHLRCTHHAKVQVLALLSIPASCEWAPCKVANDTQEVGSLAFMWNIQTEFKVLTLTWSGFGCCRHLGYEPMNGNSPSYSLSLPFSFSLYPGVEDRAASRAVSTIFS